MVPLRVKLKYENRSKISPTIFHQLVNHLNFLPVFMQNYTTLVISCRVIRVSQTQIWSKCSYSCKNDQGPSFIELADFLNLKCCSKTHYLNDTCDFNARCLTQAREKFLSLRKSTRLDVAATIQQVLSTSRLVVYIKINLLSNFFSICHGLRCIFDGWPLLNLIW